MTHKTSFNPELNAKAWHYLACLAYAIFTPLALIMAAICLFGASA